MMFSRDRVEEMLDGKLEMRLDERRDHRYYEFFFDGQWVLQTKVSTGTGYRDVGDSLIGKMTKQLLVNRRQFADLVNCPMTYDDYVRHLRAVEAI